jgi:YbgC/YbaW family acyl-CoA thioester hydrolase
MDKTFESLALIRFPDCDPFNHLNNARYLDYFINAREDHLMRGMDFNIYQVAQEQGISWVVGSHKIAYLRPALLMETVVIDSSLLSLRERDLLVEMRMWNQSKTELKALLWSTFVHVDLRTGKSIRHAEDFTRQFGEFVQPLPDSSMTFEDRVAASRQA